MVCQALTFENLFDDGENFWFTEFHYNALFKMDKKDWKPELVGVFPEEAFCQGRLYTSTVSCRDKLYFAPYMAGEIAEYDLGRKEFGKILVPMPRKNFRTPWESEKFFKAAVLRERIYFIPYHYPAILCYDIETGQLSSFDSWVDEVEEHRVNEWGYFIEYEIIGTQLILPCMCAEMIVVFDTVTGGSKVFGADATGYACKYCGCCRIGDAVYFISSDGTVSKRALGLERLGIVHLPGAGAEEVEFYPVRQAGKYLYLFPFQGGNQGFRLDPETGRAEREKLFDVENSAGGGSWKFLTALSCDGKLYAVDEDNRSFIEYDFTEGRRRSRRLFASRQEQERIDEYRRRALMRAFHENIVAEGELYSLTCMLKALQEEPALELKGTQEVERTGRKIYQVSKGE